MKENNIKIYAEEILKRFLISKNIPTSDNETKYIEKILKNLSLIIWIYKSNILNNKEEKKVLNYLKEINDNFHLHNLEEKTSFILSELKNLNPKIEILNKAAEIFWSIETNNQKDQKEINKNLDILIKKLKNQNTFNLMKIKKDIEEIQKKYITNKNTSLIIERLKYIIDQYQ